jgi:hypothetical protein
MSAPIVPEDLLEDVANALYQCVSVNKWDMNEWPADHVYTRCRALARVAIKIQLAREVEGDLEVAAAHFGAAAACLQRIVSDLPPPSDLRDQLVTLRTTASHAQAQLHTVIEGRKGGNGT